MDVKSIQNAVQQEIAAKVITNLPDEQKNIIIASAVEQILTRELMIKWDIERLLKDYAMNYAFEYIQEPKIQQKLKNMAIKATNDVIDGIVKLVGKAIEDDIKCKYIRILSDKKYAE